MDATTSLRHSQMRWKGVCLTFHSKCPCLVPKTGQSPHFSQLGTTAAWHNWSRAPAQFQSQHPVRCRVNFVNLVRQPFCSSFLYQPLFLSPLRLFLILFSSSFHLSCSILPSPLQFFSTTGDWRKLNREELHNLYASPNIIRVIKSKGIRW